MEGKSRIAVSEIVRILMEGGTVKSKTTAYDWIEKETVGFGRVVEDGQKFWEGDFSKLFTWLKNKLGEKEVVREIVEQGIPLSKYEELIKEVRRLEKEVGDKEAEVRIVQAEKEHCEKEKEELQKRIEETEKCINNLKKELEEKEEKVKKLEKTIRLKSLEEILSSLGEEDRKKVLKEIERLL